MDCLTIENETTLLSKRDKRGCGLGSRSREESLTPSPWCHGGGGCCSHTVPPFYRYFSSLEKTQAIGEAAVLGHRHLLPGKGISFPGQTLGSFRHIRLCREAAIGGKVNLPGAGLILGVPDSRAVSDFCLL